MTPFIPFSRDQAFLLPPDAKDRLPADDVAQVVVAAVAWVPLGAPSARVRSLAARHRITRGGGWRRIERATHRDIGVHCVAATLHPDHDTVAALRRAHRAAFEAACLQVLLLARRASSGAAWGSSCASPGARAKATARPARSAITQALVP